MWLTNKFIEKPVLILIIFIVFFFACLGLAVGANMAKMAESNNRDYLIWNNERVQDYDMFMEAQQNFLENQND